MSHFTEAPDQAEISMSVKKSKYSTTVTDDPNVDASVDASVSPTGEANVDMSEKAKAEVEAEEKAAQEAADKVKEKQELFAEKAEEINRDHFMQDRIEQKERDAFRDEQLSMLPGAAEGPVLSPATKAEMEAGKKALSESGTPAEMKAGQDAATDAPSNY